MRSSKMLRIGFVLAVLAVITSLTVPSSTRSAEPFDFVAYPALEVTQGVQNMRSPESGKMVPLVEGKRTYVLFYVTGKPLATSAILRITWGKADNETMLINPINNSVTVGPILPRREKGGIGRFVFELPNNRLKGNLELKAIVNPYQKHPGPESNNDNNASNWTKVAFVKTAMPTIDTWDVHYKRLTGSRVYQLADYAPTDHRALMINWLYRAYPVSDIKWWKHAIYMGRWANIGGDLKPLFGSYCFAVNWALYDHGWKGTHRYGYGMVPQTGGYMRGCADPFHDVTASGPTSNTANGGSSGDDYSGHELGHLFGRDHAAFCGAGIPKSSYPYPDGSISPVNSDRVGNDDAIAGFDILNRDVFNYEWRDIMTYCGNRWPSDVSYKKFLKHVQVGASANAQAAPTGVAMDRLVVRGVIDSATNEVHIRPSYVLTDTVESERHQPGPYTFVLRNSAGAELERYPFTPIGEASIDQGPAAQSDEGEPPIEPAEPLFFHELLPYNPATTRIDLLGPNNIQLASISAGPTAPTVKLLTANSLTRVPATQQDLLVQWEGADADGDQVHYLLQYSNDDGKTWVQYSDMISETEVTLPQENLMAGPRVRLRVLATDGIHTSADSNDTPMIVFNHAPSVKIMPPIGEALAAPSADPNDDTALPQTTYAVDQTVVLNAEGYDIDLGSLDQELTWSSDLAGVLHRGHTLATSTLGVGKHTISVTADDGSGGTASAQTVITIVPSMEDLPADPDRLMVAHDGLELHSARKPATTFVLHNQNTARLLNWKAAVDQSWLVLGASSGATPHVLSLTVKPDHGLPQGTHTATVSFTTPELPAQRESLSVTFTVGTAGVYIPLVSR